MLKNLMGLVGRNYHFRRNGYGGGYGRAEYHLALGRRHGVCAVEGICPETVIGDMTHVWSRQREFGERIDDGELAFQFFNKQAYESIAPQLADMVEEFDTLCEVGYGSRPTQ
jgi:hypothetical protein